MSDPLDSWEWYSAELPSGYVGGWIFSAASDGDSWVGVGQIWPSVTSPFEITVALSDTAGENWALTLPFSTPTDGVLTNIAYGGGKWVAVGGVSTTSTLIASASNPNGTWDVDTHSWGAPAGAVAYGDGLWAVATSPGKVYTATDPAGTWTLAHDFSGDTAPGRLARIVYADGVWAIAYREVASPYAIYVFSTTDPSGTWTARGSISGSGDGPCGIGKTPGGWFVRLEYGVATKDALSDGAWTVTTGLPSCSVLSTGPGFEYGDGYYVAMSNSASTLDIKTATSITGPFTAIDSDVAGGGGMYLFGGPFFNGEDWAITGNIDYDSLPGVLAPPSASGAGWGLLL